MSSPSSFSKMMYSLSYDKYAVTPVLPEKLLIEVAKLVISVVTISAAMETLALVPALLLSVKDIFPSDVTGLSFQLFWR